MGRPSCYDEMLPADFTTPIWLTARNKEERRIHHVQE
jgi:hypothetical protein